jgi:hypothetical protein
MKCCGNVEGGSRLSRTALELKYNGRTPMRPHRTRRFNGGQMILRDSKQWGRNAQLHEEQGHSTAKTKYTPQKRNKRSTATKKTAN